VSGKAFSALVHNGQIKVIQIKMGYMPMLAILRCFSA
jgi:hypothetical protein